MSTLMSTMNSSPVILFRRPLAKIGDLAIAVRTFELTRLKYPRSQIIVQCPHPDLIKNHPAIDSVIEWGDSYPEADVVVNLLQPLQEVDKSKYQSFCNVTSRALEMNGFDPIEWDGKPQNLWITESLASWAWSFVREYIEHGKMPIGVFWRSEQEWRTWGRMKNLIELLANDGRFATFCFDSDEKIAVDSVIQIVGFSLDKVIALVSMMKLIITPDTGGLHLAGGLGIPCLAIFGATDPKVIAEAYSNVIYPEVGCRYHPCWFKHRCIRHNCLRAINAHNMYKLTLSIYRAVHKSNLPLYWDLPNTEPMPGQKTILVGRFRGLGDIGMLWFALEAYRRDNPDTHITMITSPEAAQMFCGQTDLVDKVIIDDYKHPAKPGDFPLPIDTSQYDRVYNLINKVDFGDVVLKNPRATNFAYLLRVSLRTRPSVRPLLVSLEEKAWAKDRINWSPETKVILFQLDSMGRSRIWFNKYWLKLAELIHASFGQRVQIVFVSIREEHLALAIPFCVSNLTLETSVRQYIALAAISDVIICTDSSGLHIGGRTPTTQVIGLFGSTGKIDGEWAHTNYYNNIHYIQSDMKCSPCWDWQFTNCSQRKHAPVCLWKIKPIKVFRMLKRILEVEDDGNRSNNIER